MSILKINPSNPEPELIKKAAEILLREKAIIHPTETVYGIAALATSEKAIHQVLEIKGRELKHPFSIMVTDIREMLDWTGLSESWLEKWLQRVFPAPLTVLLPRKKELPNPYWNQFPLLGFRLPDHVLSQRLLQAVGSPIITTSANLTGDPPANSFKELSPELLKKIPLVLDGGETLTQQPSTIIKVELETRKLELVRPGSLDVTSLSNGFEK